MEQSELADIIKRRSGWRLFWPPWTLREDMDLLIVAALNAVPPAPADKSLEIQADMEKIKRDRDALMKWIIVTFGLKNVPSSDEIVDLLTKSSAALRAPKH